MVGAVLVVDDVEQNLVAMEAALAPLARPLLTATTGAAALERLLNHHVSLVVLDLRLPDMDGLEVAHMIRSRPRHEHLPIMFVTAQDVDRDLQLRAYRLGAVDFLSKPVNSEILLAKARVFTELVDHVEELAAERVHAAAEAIRRDVESELLHQRLALEASKQAQLVRLNEVLAEADRRKMGFLAILGHELRNPLAPIRTAVEIAEASGMTPRMMEVVARQSRVLARIVDDLLDITRINSNRFDLAVASEDLRAIVDEVVLSCELQFRDRRHEIRTSISDVPVVVDVDRVRIHQVIANLLINACQYTSPGGRIEIECGVRGTNASVTVRDSGRGIASSLLPSIFDMFVTERRAQDGSGGLGLGLSLARQLVEVHGGTIGVTSEGVGKGACFEFTLPLSEHRPAPPIVPVVAGSPRPPMRIVVVDDNADARELLAEMLRSCGHKVETAADGTSALELIARSAPDVAFVDLGLPELDGVELARRLRASSSPCSTRLVALTGYGGAADRIRTAEAGFAAHLVKPAALAAILTALYAD